MPLLGASRRAVVLDEWWGASEVPLGLVLGPVLFLVCVNGLLSGLSSQVCFAEDGLDAWDGGVGWGGGGVRECRWTCTICVGREGMQVDLYNLCGEAVEHGLVPLSARWYVKGDHSWGYDWHGVHLVWSGPRGCHQCKVLGD